MSFPAKTPDEIKLLTFDFTGEAASGNTLSNAAFTKSLVSGTGSASDLTIGTPQIVGLTVMALVSAGVDGAKYRLTCEVDASPNGEHHRIDKDLPVKETAALVK
jgi:hypothetical protein